MDTPCPGNRVVDFLSSFHAVAEFQVVTSAGFAQSILEVLLMVASMLSHNDRIIDWLKIVAEIRRNTKLCDEYQAVLQDETLFPWTIDTSESYHDVYKHALIMVIDIESMLAAVSRNARSGNNGEAIDAT